MDCIFLLPPCQLGAMTETVLVVAAENTGLTIACRIQVNKRCRHIREKCSIVADENDPATPTLQLFRQEVDSAPV